MVGFRTRGDIREVVALTASTTLSNDDMGKVITNRGASGSVTVTLPTPSGDNAGGTVEVRVLANQTVVVSCTSKIVTLNSATSTSVSWATSNEKIGGGGRFTSDGTSWYFETANAGANTVTIA